jgi:hypothetical protein
MHKADKPMDTVPPDYEAEVRRDIPRDFLLDVKDYFSAAAKQAELAISNSHRAIDNGIPIGVRRRNQGAGLVRYFIIDEAFEQLLARHGGEPVNSVKIEGVDGQKSVRLHLTTARFGATLIGFASHFNTDDLPVKNATRKALCAQNRGLIRDLLTGPELYRDRERFVLVMVRRDRSDIGKIASMTISISDDRISQYLMQANINDFLASYGTQPAAGKPSAITLKKDVERLRSGGKGSVRKGTE